MAKSKLPDLKEVTHIAGKLFSDIKKSVSEICKEYKNKREAAEHEAEPEDKSAKAKATKPQAAKQSEHESPPADTKPQPKATPKNDEKE